MKCEIIKDLLPSYLDGLTSDESNSEIVKHLENCSECCAVLEQMKTEIDAEKITINKEQIRPLRKLKKKIVQAVLSAVACCVLLIGSYFYFFGIGWGVHSEDLKITYSYDQNAVLFHFELTNGRVLNARTNYKNACTEIRFTECLHSVFDDRGENPNQFTYGINYLSQDGQTRQFKPDDCIQLKFKNATKTIYVKDVAENLSLDEQHEKA